MTMITAQPSTSTLSIMRDIDANDDEFSTVRLDFFQGELMDELVQLCFSDKLYLNALPEGEGIIIRAIQNGQKEIIAHDEHLNDFINNEIGPLARDERKCSLALMEACRNCFHHIHAAINGVSMEEAEPWLPWVIMNDLRPKLHNRGIKTIK
jgi:hypothetical protein